MFILKFHKQVEFSCWHHGNQLLHYKEWTQIPVLYSRVSLVIKYSLKWKKQILVKV